MTEATVAKLEEAFLWGCSDREACSYADINPSTLYRYCENNQEFSERKEMLKQNVVMRAKKVVSNEISNDNLHAAQELLKRKEGSKIALTGEEGGPVQVQTVTRTIVKAE